MHRFLLQCMEKRPTTKNPLLLGKREFFSILSRLKIELYLKSCVCVLKYILVYTYIGLSCRYSLMYVYWVVCVCCVGYLCLNMALPASAAETHACKSYVYIYTCLCTYVHIYKERNTRTYIYMHP